MDSQGPPAWASGLISGLSQSPATSSPLSVCTLTPSQLLRLQSRRVLKPHPTWLVGLVFQPSPNNSVSSTPHTLVQATVPCRQAMTTASQALCTTPAPCPIHFTAAAKISLDLSQITSPPAASHTSTVRAPSPPQPPGFLPSAQPPFLPFSTCSPLSSFLPQVLCTAVSFAWDA